MFSRKTPIIFWAWRDRPSFIMRGRQIAEAFKARGYDSSIRIGSSWLRLKDVKNSIIVCVKSTPIFGDRLTKRNNKLIYDAIDFTSVRRIPKQASAVITGNEFTRDKIEKEMSGSALVKTVYHHCDPFLKPHAAGEDTMKLVYNGARESSSFIRGEIPDLNVVSFQKHENWREKIRDYNAHFSARLDPYKSVIKLANVASMNALYLTGPEPGCVEILGKDYPFFLRNAEHLPTVLEDVQKMKESVGTSTWKDAKERIRSALPQLTLDATVDSYEKIFSQI